MITIKVSALVSKVNDFLHRSVNLSQAMISGELSNVRYVSGHCYFDLKDEQGQLSCTMWKSYASRAGFILEDGMAVLVHGTLNIYEKRGSLQLSVDSIEQAGLGALYLELEKRRQLLAAQGYFNLEHKKPKPAEIQKIGIVTGESTAALQDVLKTIRHRWPMMQVRLFPAPVQGNDAPPKIVKALKQADQAGMDAILLVRGGGSFEDLFCFNDPEIVKTLYDMKTYTVTGIGHEIDTSLADLAADQRGLTPTWAAQFVTPDQQEVKARIALLSRQMNDAMRSVFERNVQRLIFLQSSTPLASPKRWLQSRKDRQALLTSRLVSVSQKRMSGVEDRLDVLERSLNTAMQDRINLAQRHQAALNSSLLVHSPQIAIALGQNQLNTARQAMIKAMEYRQTLDQGRLNTLQSSLMALSPQSILERGYSIVRMDGQTIKEADKLSLDAQVSIQFYQGQATARIQSLLPEESSMSHPLETPSDEAASR